MKIYDFSDLKDLASDADHKAALLELLLAFDRFCGEHGLTYYLSGGTLLGAVRHQGFIPWDDDVDVNMPRADCEKLMELSGGRIGDFELLPPNFTPQYFAYHWKLFSEKILVARREQGRIDGVIKPIFLDIFPIEGLPNTEAENIEHYAEIRRLKNSVSHARGIRKYVGKNPLRWVRNRAAIRVHSKQGLENLFNKVIEFAKSISFDDAKYVGVMMTNVHTTEERVVKNEYVPVIKLDFAGHPLSCPAGYDTYLTQLYGSNYMEWLPVYKRVSRHDFVPFFSYAEGEKPAVFDARLETGDDKPPVTDDEETLDDHT